MKADTLIMAMHAPSLTFSRVKAGYEAIDLCAQLRHCFRIGSTRQQEWDGRCFWIMLFEDRFDHVEEWRLQVGLQRQRRIDEIDIRLVTDDRRYFFQAHFGCQPWLVKSV